MDDNNNDDDSDDDDIMNILNDDDNNDADSDSDDSALFFNNESESQKLQLEFSLLDSNAYNNSSNLSSRPSNIKRRRSSTASTGSHMRKRAVVLSINGLLETLNRLASLQQQFDRAQLTLEQIDESIAAKDASQLATLVGDDLQREFRLNTQQQQQIQQTLSLRL